MSERVAGSARRTVNFGAPEAYHLYFGDEQGSRGSIYFREPQGILFEIASTSAGFAVDEDPDHLGDELRLPTQHEHLRPQLERLLTPLTNPRSAHRTEVQS